MLHLAMGTTQEAYNKSFSRLLFQMHTAAYELMHTVTTWCIKKKYRNTNTVEEILHHPTSDGSPANNGIFSISTGEFTGFLQHQQFRFLDTADTAKKQSRNPAARGDGLGRQEIRWMSSLNKIYPSFAAIKKKTKDEKTTN